MSIDDFHLAVEPCVDEIIGLTPRATAVLSTFSKKNQQLVMKDITRIAQRAFEIMIHLPEQDHFGEFDLQWLIFFLASPPPASLEVIMQYSSFTLLKTNSLPRIMITNIQMIQ